MSNLMFTLPFRGSPEIKEYLFLLTFWRVSPFGVIPNSYQIHTVLTEFSVSIYISLILGEWFVKASSFLFFTAPFQLRHAGFWPTLRAAPLRAEPTRASRNVL